MKSEASEKLEVHENEINKKQLLNELLNSSKQIMKVFMLRNNYKISIKIKVNQIKIEKSKLTCDVKKL